MCECIVEMLDYWKDLAVKNGFSGLKIASQRFEKPEDNYQAYNYLDYHIEYQPDYDKCHYKNADKLTFKFKEIC